jgi:hypothetical protein
MDEIAGRFVTAASQTFNLAMNIGYVTEQTTVPLIVKAHMDALALAVGANIYTKESIPQLLAKANMQMQALKSKVD